MGTECESTGSLWTIPDAGAEYGQIKNVHGGEVRLEEFWKPLGLSQTRLAPAAAPGVNPRCFPSRLAPSR
jgi:hypothetical protein